MEEESVISDNPGYAPPLFSPWEFVLWVGCVDAHSWANKLSATLWIDRSMQLLWSCNKQEWNRKSKAMTAQTAYVVQ